MEPYIIALGGFITGIACLVTACAIIRGGQCECECDEHEDVAKPGESHE